MKKLIFASFTCAALFFATSCGSNGNSDNSANTENVTSNDDDMDGMDMSDDSSDDADASADDNLAVVSSIAITGNDQMQYSETKFKVKAREPIKISLKNAGTMPATASSHDIVILKPGSDVTDFGNAAAKDKSGDHIPADKAGEVLGHTKMLGPGESDEITVTFPSAGVYPFLCSFPGHFMSMQGTITVE